MHDSGLEDQQVVEAEPCLFLRPKFEGLGCIGLYAKLISSTVFLDRVTWTV
jgi:hypothetical protein